MGYVRDTKQRARRRSVAARQAMALGRLAKREEPRHLFAGPYAPARECQHIAGEPTRDDSCKCLAMPTVENSSYCAKHYPMCVQRVAP